MSQSGVPLNSTPIQSRSANAVASKMNVATEAASGDAALHVPNPTRTARPVEARVEAGTSGAKFTKERTDAMGPRFLAQGQSQKTGVATSGSPQQRAGAVYDPNKARAAF